jgi:hypothetical protein
MSGLKSLPPTAALAIASILFASSAAIFATLGASAAGGGGPTSGVTKERERERRSFLAGVEGHVYPQMWDLFRNPRCGTSKERERQRDGHSLQALKGMCIHI